MDGPDPAPHVGLDEVGTKLVADPEVPVHDLQAFGVKVGTGEVAHLRALVDDAKRYLLVRVVQEDRLQALELAAPEVHRVPAEKQHEVG